MLKISNSRESVILRTDLEASVETPWDVNHQEQYKRSLQFLGYILRNNNAKLNFLWQITNQNRQFPSLSPTMLSGGLRTDEEFFSCENTQYLVVCPTVGFVCEECLEKAIHSETL